MFIGWALAVFAWNLFWVIEDDIKGRDYIDRYDIEECGWLAVFFWLYLISGFAAIMFS